MQIEDHILWRITEAYDLLYRTYKKFKDGELSHEDYVSIIEPKCSGIMMELLECIESGDFLDYHRRNMQLPPGAGYPGRDKHGFPHPDYCSGSVIRKYTAFVRNLHDAMTQTDLTIKSRELIIGFDSFVGWMHGTYEISQWIMKQNPITGNPSEDYSIAISTMYLISYKRNADSAIAYLRACAKENRHIEMEEWRNAKMV
jgi:hypothetical protein